jgi:5-methylcytosine-specific restriction endonuclease McrA
MRVKIPAKKLKKQLNITQFDLEFLRLKKQIEQAQDRGFSWDARKQGDFNPPGFIKSLRNDPCVYCVLYGENDFSIASTVDHIKALSRGGRDDWRNKAPACMKHNVMKGRTQLLRFLMRLRWEYDRLSNQSIIAQRSS